MYNIKKIAKINFIHKLGKFSRVYYKDDYKGQIYAKYNENETSLTPLGVFDEDNKFNEYFEQDAEVIGTLKESDTSEIVIFMNVITNKEMYQTYKEETEEGKTYGDLSVAFSPGY